MNRSYKDLLSDILHIANYQNKEDFISEFERLNHLDTMVKIVPQLSPDVQEFIKANIADTEKIKPYVPYDLYFNELLTVSAEALRNFVTYIKPTLNAQQRQSISQLFAA